MQIFALQQYPDRIQELAEWHQVEWRASGRQVPIARRIQRLQSHLQTPGLPNTWLALEGDRLLGSVSLVDYVFHADCIPSAWVANLFVVPRFRGRGLGQHLLAHAEAVARETGLQRLYLFTPDQRQFYARRNWQFLHQARVQGQWADVMTKPMDKQADLPKAIGNPGAKEKTPNLHLASNGVQW